jgi:hypothetical protein
MHFWSRQLIPAFAGVVALSGSLVGLAAVGAPASAGAAASHTISEPSNVDFGNVTLGDLAIKSFPVTNTGSTLVTIAGDSITGDAYDFFAFPDLACPFLDQSTLVMTLATGQSCNIDYFFNPGAIGARSASLTFVDQNGVPVAVPLSLTCTGTIGYYQVSSTGKVAHFGDAAFFGDTSQVPLNHPIVGMAQTGDNGGYWLAASDGGIFNYGDAPFLGSAGAIRLNKPVVGMTSTGDGQGYWLVATDGGIFSYGDATFLGSTGNLTLNKPIVGMAATNDGSGYWLVASDGGIFAYGDAQFFGSTGNMHLNQPIVGMAPTPDNGGYWLVAADGGVFAYGDAQFFGSTGNIHLAKPITGMAAMPDGHGYWFTANDGGLFNYGNAPFHGAAFSQGIGDVVGMASDGAVTAQAAFDTPALRHASAKGDGGWVGTPLSGKPIYANP